MFACSSVASMCNTYDLLAALVFYEFRRFGKCPSVETERLKKYCAWTAVETWLTTMRHLLIILEPTAPLNSGSVVKYIVRVGLRHRCLTNQGTQYTVLCKPKKSYTTAS